MSDVYRMNHAGFSEMAVGPEIAAAVRAVAEKAKAYAESISPRSTQNHQHYADSFEVTTEIVRRGSTRGTRRAAGVLTNTSPHAAAVEWGNQHTREPHRVLGRTLANLEHL